MQFLHPAEWWPVFVASWTTFCRGNDSNSKLCNCLFKVLLRSKNHFLFSSDFDSVIAQHLTGKIFIQRLFTLCISFRFHGPPLLTLQTDRLDLIGLDIGKSDVIYS